MKRLGLNTLSIIAALLMTLISWPVLGADNWPQFRGPTQNGHVAGSPLVTSWSEKENIRWRLDIPGSGWSSPVIWGDQLWMTAALDNGHTLAAICVSKQGKLIHQVKIFSIDELEAKNALNSFASPSPVVEAGRVYIHFGSYGTACLDSKNGTILWSRQDINLDHQEGPGSSPVLFEDLLIFHCDGRDVQFLAALDKRTGKTAWKTARSIDLSVVNDYQRKAFSTPTLLSSGGRMQLVSSAAQGCYSYDPGTGEELWRVRYPGFSAVPRPVTDGRRAFVVTDFGKPEMWAVRLDGRGDVTESHVDWTAAVGISSTPSAALIDDLIYQVADKTGVVSCLDAKTGELVWRHRAGGSFSASPIHSDGRIFFFDRDGKTTVLAAGRELKQLAVNELSEGCMASPAASEGAIYLRSATHLYRIEAAASQP